MRGDWETDPSNNNLVGMKQFSMCYDAMGFYGQGQPLKVESLLPGFYQLRIFDGHITQSLGFVKQ